MMKSGRVWLLGCLATCMLLSVIAAACGQSSDDAEALVTAVDDHVV